MAIKQIDIKLLNDLMAKAGMSPRKRAHHNLHPVLEDPVQRLCVAIEPGTYIRPHRHADPLTWEVFLMLRGSAVYLSFDDSGRVSERIVLAQQVRSMPSRSRQEPGIASLRLSRDPSSSK